jgi:hypothetical protein
MDGSIALDTGVAWVVLRLFRESRERWRHGGRGDRVSVNRALERLPGDRATEATVREVLEVMRIHRHETISSHEVARRLERPEHLVSVILSALADAYVLIAEGGQYRYDADPLNDMDVERFVRRADSHSRVVQNNVAKFRERYGHH